MHFCEAVAFMPLNDFPIWVVIAIVLLILSAGIALSWVSHFKQSHARLQAWKRATPAEAKILQVEEQRVSLLSAQKRQMRQPLHGFKLDLEVMPKYGLAYPATAYWQGPQGAMQALKAGRSIKIRVDREEPQLIYPDLPGVTHHELLAKYWQLHEIYSKQLGLK